jgi:hypothetical protein
LDSASGIRKDDGLLQILQKNFVKVFVTPTHWECITPSARNVSGHDEKWSLPVGRNSSPFVSP